ncbi:restriction endonuclease subunit S [Arcobacter porcinus]|uniref:Type I restriction modification DNA specificity domain protein n=1 Tax=Arcobacter porcinus TaxID=1935204 RepID=A0ABX2YA94_9BACT|nr:restriction endonuclease subunit S [Arcobacter porcinus]OCL90294.1 Type I restriction modification DNA specificity domain protein [Arcobacter porcinus]
MSKITYTHLRDICDVNQGLQIPIEERFKEAKENRYFYITVQFLKDSYLEKYYVENPSKSTICEEDDILVVRTGNTGQIITGIKGCFHNNFFKVNFDKNKLNSKYLYYCLTTKEKQYEMAKRAGITTIPDLNHFMFLDMQIPLQEKENQDKIVQILDSLNSKIELNNKINKELEAMAKTLYDYWFVQFDFPDEHGQPYKSSGGKMVYNKELKREIPKGWDVKDLEEICEIYQPQTISEKEMIKDGKYFVFGANGIVGMYDKYNHEDSEVTITCRGNSCGTLNRTLPYSWITGNAMVVRFKDDKIHNEYLMQLLSWTKMDNVITGSAQPQITRTNLAPLKILIPKNNILDNFSQKMEFNINLQLKNIEQNQELAKLRDWLLPMLMNGQVKVEI